MNTNLSRSAARKIAIKKTLLQFSFPLAFIAVCGPFFAVLTFYPQLFIDIVGWTMAVLIVAAVILCVIVAYKNNLEELTRPMPSTVWKKNSGEAPNHEKVNVLHENGFVCWSVRPSEKNWSTDIDNPIKEYMNCIDSERRKKIDNEGVK